jgi:hypothetical protein
MAHGHPSLSRRISLVGAGLATLALGALTLAPVQAQQLSLTKGPLWTKAMSNNQYQLYRVNFNQAATNGGNVAQVTWPQALVPAWMGISAYDDTKDDAVNGLLANGKTRFALGDPLLNTIAGVPDCATAIIKVRNLTPVAIIPWNQWFTLSANVSGLQWVAPPTFGRVAGGVTWSNNKTQGTVNLLNTGGVTAYDVTLTILNALRLPMTAPVPVASSVGPRAALALTFAVPAGAHVGTQLYVQLNYHAVGEVGHSAFAVYVGQ